MRLSTFLQFNLYFLHMTYSLATNFSKYYFKKIQKFEFQVPSPILYRCIIFDFSLLWRNHSCSSAAISDRFNTRKFVLLRLGDNYKRSKVSSRN